MTERNPDIVIDCELDAPPEKVWRALTVPELLAAWLLPNDIVPEAGRRFRVANAPGGDVDCEVLASEPPRRLSYRWRGAAEGGERDPAGRPLDTVVTFELEATPSGGTRLRLVHDGFPTRLPRTSAIGPKGTVAVSAAFRQAA
jgi:uncharacterized protein YndB with AHSA1/START domain